MPVPKTYDNNNDSNNGGSSKVTPTIIRVANFITAYEVSQENRDSNFLFRSVFFVSKLNAFDVYFTTLRLVLVPCGGGRTSAHSTIVRIIFHFLLDHWAHCGMFENGVLLIYTLKDVSSVANFITAMKSLNKTDTLIF